MIRTKKDLQLYIGEDAKQSGYKLPSSIKEKIIEVLFPDYNHEFMVCLRKLEYYSNKRGGVMNKLLFYYYSLKHSNLRAKTGIELNVNVADYGLHISHGKVVVSSIAKIGKNCKILSDVTIGGQGRYDRDGAPIIGDRVFIGSGAKIIGAINIADDVVIGANSVVTKDILEPNTTWAGNPAKKVSDKGSFHYLNR